MDCDVLVIEDDADMALWISAILEPTGCRYTMRRDGRTGLQAAGKSRFDLILLDLTLPDQDGLDVLKALKRDPATSGIPVMIITGRGGENDVVAGLDLGAEDYLVKPFRPRVLLSRAKAILRRRTAPPPSGRKPVRAGPFRIDELQHEASVLGKPVGLTATQFRLLLAFARQPGRVFTRRQLLEACHGAGASVTERAVDAHLYRLRRALGKAGAWVETVPGVGYRLRRA